MIRVSEAIAKLQAIMAERGDVYLVMGDGFDPLKERDVDDIREAAPYDFHERYTSLWRAVIEAEE